jgi:hypothetical protein
MDKSLARAKIEVIALDRAVKVGGLDTRELVEVPAGRGLSLPADTSTESGPVIFVPGPLDPGVQAALRIAGMRVAAEGPVELIPEDKIALLTAEQPLVYSLHSARQLDLRDFRPAADQATHHDRRLVILSGEADGGS